MKKIFVWFKKFLLKYKDVESRKFGDKVHAHPRFATVTVVLAMIVGAVFMIAAVLEDDLWVMLLGATFLVYLMALQVAESVMASNTLGTAFKRFGLLLGFTLASFVIGAVTSVVLVAVLAILAIMLVIYVILALVSGALSASGTSSRRSGGSNNSTEEELTVTDEHGYERKLKDVGLGRYQDDKGDYWKSDGWNSVSRE